MPFHGELRQLTKHASLAEHLRASCLEETFVMESGDVLEIDHHGARRAGVSCIVVHAPVPPLTRSEALANDGGYKATPRAWTRDGRRRR
jgi:hypothetical protein